MQRGSSPPQWLRGSSPLPLRWTAETVSEAPAPMQQPVSMASPTPKPKLWLYLDYNGVLNQDGVEGLLDFMVKVDHLPGDLTISLVSHLLDPHCMNVTLNEIADAGVLDIFDELVFTKDRRTMADAARELGRLGRPRVQWKTIVQEFPYEPLCPRQHPPLPESGRQARHREEPDKEPVDEDRIRHCFLQRRKAKHWGKLGKDIIFKFFHGGKDQWLYSRHQAPPATEMLRRSDMLRGLDPPDGIFFVDDKWETLEAVRALHQLPGFRGSVQCVEMRRKIFLSGSGAWHANSLSHLHSHCFQWMMLQEKMLGNHAAQQRWNTMLQNSHAAPRAGAAEGSGAAPPSGAAEQESGAAERSGAAPRGGAAEQCWDTMMQRAVENNAYL